MYFLYLVLYVHVYMAFSWMFLGLKTFIKHEGIPVDELVVQQHIRKDRRHASKPDTGALFAGRWSGVIHVASSLFFVLTRNTLLLIITIMVLVLIAMAVYYSFM